MGVRIGVAIGSAKLVRGGRHRLVRGLRGQRAPSRDAKHRARQLRCLGRLHERREPSYGEHTAGLTPKWRLPHGSECRCDVMLERITLL